MNLFTFVLTVIFVTASGALAPGPTFFANITEGARSGAKSGLAFSVGHTILEFTLVMFLALTLGLVANQPLIKLAVGVAGGAALLGFGLFQIREGLTLNRVFKRKKTCRRRTLCYLVLFSLA